MRRRIAIIPVLFCLAILLSSCTSIKLPTDDQIKADFSGLKTLSVGASKYNIDNLLELEVIAVQDNIKENKSASYTVNAQWEDESKQAIISDEIKLSYAYYDQGGWKLEAATADADKMALKPNFSVTDEQLIEAIEKRGVSYKTESNRKLIIGATPQLDGAYSNYYHLFSQDIISDIKIITNSYDDNKEIGKFTAQITAETDSFTFVGLYYGEITFKYPGWTCEFTVASQDVLPITDNQIKEKLMDYKLPYAITNGNRFVVGDVSSDDGQAQFGASSGCEVTDITILTNTYDEKTGKAAFTAQAILKSDKFTFTGVYSGELSGDSFWTMDNVTVTSQDVKIHFPNEIETTDITNAIGAFTKLWLSAVLNGDSNGNFVDGIVTISTTSLWNNNNASYRYNVSVQDSSDSNGILLKAGDWIDQPDDTIDRYDVLLYVSAMPINEYFYCDLLIDGKVAKKVWFSSKN